MKSTSTMALKDVADIRSGFHFATRFDEDQDGDYCVIQSKDVDGNGVLAVKDLARVSLEHLKEKYLIKKGDVLFKAKTSSPVAAVVEQLPADTIVTTHFFILRIWDRSLSPGYLAWYLNSPMAKRFFEANAVGTHFAVVNKKALGDITIIVPPVGVQEKIVKIHGLWLSEEEMLERISELKGGLVEAQLTKAIEHKGV